MPFARPMYWPIWLVSARLFALTLLELLRIIGHREAVEAGRIWLDAEAKELGNHARNASWTSIPRSEVPSDRRIHKLIWVYKLKRDGSAKARLCVQGNTLQSGVDFDQTWSSALRYSSARALFAYAARKGCRVRSVDLVAAYLQGRFVDGEVVYR